MSKTGRNRNRDESVGLRDSVIKTEPPLRAKRRESLRDNMEEELSLLME